MGFSYLYVSPDARVYRDDAGHWFAEVLTVYGWDYLYSGNNVRFLAYAARSVARSQRGKE